MKPPPTRAEIIQWVKDHLRGDSLQDIATRAGRSPQLVSQKLFTAGAYRFLRRPAAKP